MLIPIRGEHPISIFPFVVLIIIAANLAAFGYELLQGAEGFGVLVARWGLVACEITQGKDIVPELPVSVYVTALTSMFLHASWIHLVLNMLYLWIFGKNVEGALGHCRFLVFYLLCGLSAALVHVASDPLSARPTIGASGAVSGLMGAYLVLYPRSKVLTFVVIRFFRLPAVVVLLTWIAVQFWWAVHGGQEQVAWIAHIGGFIGGLLMVPLFRKAKAGKAKS